MKNDATNERANGNFLRKTRIQLKQIQQTVQRFAGANAAAAAGGNQMAFV